jgi:predicted transposase YbfD/YdcC
LRIGCRGCENRQQVTRHLSRAQVLQAPAPGWEHITEFWKIETITLDPVTQHSSSEIRYFATSLLPSTLNNKEVLQAIRAHWGIENNANWCFDVHWKEDTAPWTSRAMPLVSYLRMIAYNIIERLKTRRLKAARNRVLGWKDFFKFFEHALCRLRYRLETSGEAYPAFIA